MVFEEKFQIESVVKIKEDSVFIRHQNIAKIQGPYNHELCLNFG